MAKLTIRTSAKNECCSLRVSPQCSHDEEGKVVLAHLNSNYRGTGFKSPDILAVYSCHECHLLLDASKVDYEDQQRGMFETLMKLVDKGLVRYG
jgi:hypothetical protein